MEAELQQEADGFARALAGAQGALAGAAPRGEGATQAALRVEDVVQQPLPGYTQPVSFAFSSDGKLLTCLWSPEGTLTRQLYGFDPATRRLSPLLSGAVSEARMSLEEKLRRERTRERGLGVSRYYWSKRGNVVLVPDTSGLLVHSLGGAVECAVAAAPGAAPLLDPQLSPDGSMLAFVRDGDLFVAPAAASGAPARQLTFRNGATTTHGLAEYIAQEEMQRPEGFWWSPDGSALAFCAVDDDGVARFRIPHLSDADPYAEEVHAYPFAGAANARVRLAVVSLASGAITWLDCDCGGRGSQHVDEEYLARVAWTADGKELLVQVQDRTQQHLRVVSFDPGSGARLRTVLDEAGVPWINLSDAWRPLAGGALLWSSERSGFRHFYLYEEGGKVAAVTSGEWSVDALEAVDETNGLVYFTATLDSALERHLYVAPLRPTGQPPRKLTHAAGMHSVVLDHDCSRFVDVHDSPVSAPRVTLRSAADGSELLCIWEPEPLRAWRLGLKPPKLFTVPAADGTELHAALFTPDGAGPWPLVVSVYGGPHVQTVTRSWAMTVDMRAQLLRSRGFAVLKLDNRGSSRRGLAFEASLRVRMGTCELEDQAAGVAALVASGVADPARVGIYGWSYGGYVSALAALRMPSVFRAAVAGAPVTSWDGYDTHYTERYMGLPQSEAAAYAAASALRAEPGAPSSSPLLIIHGMLDENVHVRHTTRLVAVLTQRCAPHELLLFPDERHLPRGLEGRAYTERRVLGFLERELKG